MLLLLKVMPISATTVDRQLLGMGATAVSSKPSRTGTLSSADSAIVTSVFCITEIRSSHPLLLQVNPPNLLGPFGSCVATGSPCFAIFSTSKVIYSKFFLTVDTLRLSLYIYWSSCGRLDQCERRPPLPSLGQSYRRRKRLEGNKETV